VVFVYFLLVFIPIAVYCLETLVAKINLLHVSPMFSPALLCNSDFFLLILICIYQ